MRELAIRGTLWLVPARGVQAMAHFAGIFVLARYYLDPEQLGLAALVLAVSGLLGAGADLGMGVLGVQRTGIDDRRAARLAGLAGLVCAAVMCGCAPLIAKLLGNQESMVPLLRAGSLALLLAGIISSARTRLSRSLSFRTIGCVDMGVAVTAAGARIAFAAAGHGAWSIILGDLLAAIVGSGAVWLLAPSMKRGDRGQEPLLPDGVRIVGTRAADSAFAQADRFLIGRWLGTGALGLYGFAWQHAMLLVTQLTPVAEQIALPLFARIQRDRPKLKNAYLALTHVNALIVIPLAGLLHLIAPWLVELLYPARWQESVPVMRALCVAAAAAGLNSHPGLVWMAMGRMRLRVRWSLANLVALIGVIAVGLNYGAVGVAYALAARSLLATVVAQIITQRQAGVGHAAYAKAVLPGLVIGAAFGALSLL